ncbi:MAG TPA: MarR family transcriptional regulator [Rhizomicrobium sp.]|jgi:DNA-binding MarR family transcriptional regulator
MSSRQAAAHGGGNLGYLIKRAQLAFRARMDAGLKALGITAPQYAVLSSLSIEPGISNAALARVAFVTPQSMLGIVENLEKLKLIAREADPDHGRILQANLTAKGRDALSQAHKIANGIEAEMTANVPKKEVMQAKRLLICFAENLDG